MTLLVLPLVGGEEGSLGAWTGFAGRVRSCTPFAIGFWVIGLYRMDHHRMFRRIQAYDETLIRQNLLLLFLIAFLPYPSAIIMGRFATTSTRPCSPRATLSAIGLVVTLLVWNAFRYRDLGEPMTSPSAACSCGA